MIRLSLKKLADITSAQLIGEDTYIDSVSTDTRQIDHGALFIALVGERFDGHQFVAAAEQKATALLVSHRVNSSLPQLIVKDTKLALGQIGAWVCEQSQVKTIAITGSCGKTTVKEMLASILAKKGKTLATLGNFNNDIGVPLTLLRLDQSYEYAVIEMGANHQHEIEYTTQLVHPQIAAVNNVDAAHLEGFGSIDGVKKAKGEIFLGLPEGGVALINMDSQGDELWQSVLADKQVYRFSYDNSLAEFYASHVSFNEKAQPSFTLHTSHGSETIHLQLVGKHNVTNAVAASALALQAGVTLDQVKQGLESLGTVKGRVQVETLSHNLKLIDDSYNASVPAMKAAIDLLASFNGQRWLILGYMAELGEESLELHRQVGEYAVALKFEQVLTFGEDAKVISELNAGHHFSSYALMMDYISQNLDPSQTNTLLIKGANSAKMGQLVSALKETY